MTTVAYKDGIMAADTGGTLGDIRSGFYPKIFKTKNGMLIGGCGNISGFRHYLAQIEKLSDDDIVNNNFKINVVSDNFTLLIARYDVLKAREIVYYGDNAYVYPMEDEFFAIGSGRQIALGSMGSDKSAIYAVELAMRWDVYTNGEITHMKLDNYSKSSVFGFKNDPETTAVKMHRVQ